MAEYLQVITTLDNLDKAEEMAKELVKSGYASCVQISAKIRSIYKWKGKIEESDEYYLVVKTTEDLYNNVEELIKAHHNYELPEIIALKIERGYEPYLNWIREQVISK